MLIGTSLALSQYRPPVSAGGGASLWASPTLHEDAILGYDFTGATSQAFQDALVAQFPDTGDTATRDTTVLLNDHATLRSQGAGIPGGFIGGYYGEAAIAPQPYLWFRTLQKSVLPDAGGVCDGGLFSCDDAYDGYTEPLWRTTEQNWKLNQIAAISAADPLHSGRETWLAWRHRAVENDILFFVNGVNLYEGAGQGSIAAITKVGLNFAIGGVSTNAEMNLGHVEVVAGNLDPHGLL